MNKNTVKKLHDPFRALAVKEAAKKCECTEQYVRQVIGNTNLMTGRAEEIRQVYKERYSAYQSQSL